MRYVSVLFGCLFCFVSHFFSVSSDILQAMNEIMKEFEEMGKKDDFQSVVDNMMKQLLSKDIMYEPVVEITKRVRAV